MVCTPGCADQCSLTSWLPCSAATRLEQIVSACQASQFAACTWHIPIRSLFRAERGLQETQQLRSVQRGGKR